MKKIIIMALFVLATTPVLAAGPHNTAGVKLDAPDLVRFTDNLTLGIEGGKDLATDVFYKAGDGVSYFEADRGYFVYAKVTWKRTLLNFKK